MTTRARGEPGLGTEQRWPAKSVEPSYRPDSRSIRRACQRAVVCSAAVTWPEIATVGILAAQLIVLVGAAGVAWYQAREARRLRLEQHRPFVVIDVDFVGTAELFLYVKNLGTSLARSVKFEIDPPLSSAVEIPVDKFKMLTDGVSTLAPGKELRTFFDIGFQRKRIGPPACLHGPGYLHR